MSNSHLFEEMIASQELVKGRLLHVFRDTVRLPNSTFATREFCVHPGAVMIIPLLESEGDQVKVVLERQFRYPLNKVMIEFPAGKLDVGETCLACAQRELREETGYSAKYWAHAGVLHPAIAYSNEFIDIWFARDLQKGDQKLDDGELLDVFVVSPDDLQRWCLSGSVTDAKTLAGALWLQNVLSGSWSLDWRELLPF